MLTGITHTCSKPMYMPSFRQNHLHVLTTDAERRMLQKAADLATLPLSTWMREVTLREARNTLADDGPFARAIIQQREKVRTRRKVRKIASKLREEKS
jgi:uncharacterized protein (DUF1778 family)